jgi:hypothetical protein
LPAIGTQSICPFGIFHEFIWVSPDRAAYFEKLRSIQSSLSEFEFGDKCLSLTNPTTDLCLRKIRSLSRCAQRINERKQKSAENFASTFFRAPI